MSAPALVIGSGPAGLMAAEALTEAGLPVMVAEAKPSMGRKFLMAGKSGLNLTKDQPDALFQATYGHAGPALLASLQTFGPREVIAWTQGLGQEVFTGSSGRVFPTTMKASPLLRAWSARLRTAGATLHTGWRWIGWEGDQTLFETPDGPVSLTPAVTVLALGGASWARLGSDGRWTKTLTDLGAVTEPFRPANIGFHVNWTPPMTRHFGTPVKGVTLSAGRLHSRGEAVISSRGIEGGGVYGVSSAARDGVRMHMDLLPDMSEDKIVRLLSIPQGKASLSNFLRKSLRLPPVKVALLREFGHPMPEDPTARARLIKALPIVHAGTRPLDEAISVAGGLSWPSMDQDLMLNARPGVFCAGEMLDWEAPTGGYLITACLATGRRAGQAAAQWAKTG